jgi:hypothetical protein
MCLLLLFFTIFYSRVISVSLAFAYSCGLPDASPPACHRNPYVPTPSLVTFFLKKAFAKLEFPTNNNFCGRWKIRIAHYASIDFSYNLQLHRYH